jgi:signal transduction histidine kinase
VRLDATAATNEGVGLGLPVCRRLLQAQGGDISVRAREGGGSRFTFSLPGIPDDAAELPAQQSALVSE